MTNVRIYHKPLQVYQLLDQAWGSYTSFCSSYEGCGKELGTLVAAALQPYVPGLLAGASDLKKAKAAASKALHERDAEIANLTLKMQQLQETMKTAEEQQIAFFKEILEAINSDWRLTTYFGNSCNFQSYRINQMSEPAKALLRQALGL
jgi:hypothetical protein